MGAVNIGETGEYCFIAEVPGVFKYNCSGVNVAAMFLTMTVLGMKLKYERKYKPIEK